MKLGGMNPNTERRAAGLDEPGYDAGLTPKSWATDPVGAASELGDSIRAMREMTPNEIRVEELKKIRRDVRGALVGSLKFEQLVQTRIDLLEGKGDVKYPPSADSPTSPYVGDHGLTILPNVDPKRLYGSKLDISIELRPGMSAHTIPLDQLRQLLAIASGKPSPETREELRGIRERLDAAKAELSVLHENQKDRDLKISIAKGLELLKLAEVRPDLLGREEARSLASWIRDAIQTFLVPHG